MSNFSPQTLWSQWENDYHFIWVVLRDLLQLPISIRTNASFWSLSKYLCWQKCRFHLQLVSQSAVVKCLLSLPIADTSWRSFELGSLLCYFSCWNGIQPLTAIINYENPYYDAALHVFLNLVLEWRSFFFNDFQYHDYIFILLVVNLTLIKLYNSHKEQQMSPKDWKG